MPDQPTQSHLSDPLHALPKLFSRYVAHPRKVAVVWGLVVTGVFLLVAQGHSPSRESSPSRERLYDSSSASSVDDSSSTGSSGGYSSSSYTTARIGTPINIEVAVADGRLTINSGPLEGAWARRISPTTIELNSASGSLLAFYQVTPREDGNRIEILDGDSNMVYRVKSDDEGLKLILPSSDLAARLKIKEDKFNIYNSSGNRIYYGKEKRGAILIRDDQGRDLTTINANRSLTLLEAALLCLPVEPQYKSLLFLNALLPS